MEFLAVALSIGGLGLMLFGLGASGGGKAP